MFPVLREQRKYEKEVVENLLAGQSVDSLGLETRANSLTVSLMNLLGWGDLRVFEGRSCWLMLEKNKKKYDSGQAQSYNM